MKELEGLILATAESYVKKREIFKNPIFFKDDKFDDPLSLGLGDILLNFGTECICKGMAKRTQKIKVKATNFIRKYYKPFQLNGKNVMIDSGGFQILGGKVPLHYIDYLSEMYTDFIVESRDLEDMYFMYLDVNPIKGIHPQFATQSMLVFQNKLEEKTKNNKQNEKVYLIYHCNTPLAYKTFLDFFDNEHIPERIGSHRYGVGGMVKLSFHQEHLQIKPYLYPLFEVIERERDYLEHGGEVWYHILGTSGMFEEFLIIWCMLYFHLIGWKLHITFDSSTALTKATRSDTLFHVDENKKITLFGMRHELMKEKPNNHQNCDKLNEWYMMDVVNKVKAAIPPKEPYIIENIDQCFEQDGIKFRWSSAFSYSAIMYQFWSFSEVYRIFKKSIFDNPEIITDSTGNFRYEHLMHHFNDFMYIKNMKSFNKKTYRSLNNSLEYLIRFVEKKVNILTIRQMCYQDVAANEKWISYRDDKIILEP